MISSADRAAGRPFNRALALLVAGVLVGLLAAAASDASGPRPVPASRVSRSLEQTALQIINSERHTSGLRPLKLSTQLRSIAEYRGRQDASIRAANPGYDVNVSLSRAHICRRRAREWGLGEVGAEDRVALQYLMGNEYFSNPSYRGDILYSGWRQIGVAVVKGLPHRTSGLTVVEDFIVPC